MSMGQLSIVAWLARKLWLLLYSRHVVLQAVIVSMAPHPLHRTVLHVMLETFSLFVAHVQAVTIFDLGVHMTPL